jgi:hypothetical protein
MRYNLKKLYFNGVPADKVRTTSPLKSMTDDQWRELWRCGQAQSTRYVGLKPFIFLHWFVACLCLFLCIVRQFYCVYDSIIVLY